MTDEIEQLLRNLHLKKIAAIIDDELAHAEGCRNDRVA